MNVNQIVFSNINIRGLLMGSAVINAVHNHAKRRKPDGGNSPLPPGIMGLMWPSKSVVGF